MIDEGRRRAVASLARIREGALTQSEIGSRILSAVIVDYSLAIDNWLNEPLPVKRGGCAQSCIEALGSKTTATIAARVILDSLGKSTTANRLSFAIAKVIEVEISSKQLTDRALRFAKKLRRTKESLVTAATRTGSSIELIQYNDQVRAALGLVLIELFRASTGLIDTPITRTRRRTTPRMVVPSVELLEWMDEAIQKKAYLRPRYGAMDEQPSDWTGQYEGGYKTLRLRGLIKGNGGDYSYEFDPNAVWVRAINRLQKQPWSCLTDTLDEVIRCYTDDQAKRRLGFNVLETTKSNVRNRVLRERYIQSYQHRYEEQRIIATAAEARRTTFYFPWFCDFRGRMYPIPSGLQPQGQDLARGLLAFADQQPVDQTVWFERGNQILGCDARTFARDWDGTALGLPPTAPNPVRALSYLTETRRILNGATHSGYPFFLDGKCNGLQMISLLLRDPNLARATNVIGSGEDIYLSVADQVYRELSKDLDNPHALRLIRLFKGVLPRALAKRIVMVIPYGATQHTIREVITSWYDEVLWQSDTRFRKEDKDSIVYLAAVFIKVLRNSYPSCMVALEGFREIAKTKTSEVRWTSPSGFPVLQLYRKSKKVRVETFVHGKLVMQKVREKHGVDMRQMKEGLLPNFIHSLDAAIAHKVLCEWPVDRPIVTIHDSFGTTSNYLDDLRKVIKESVSWVFAQEPHLFFNDPPIQCVSGIPIPIGNFMYD